jgi:hypothetical protein
MLSLGISAVTYGLKGSQPEMAKQEDQSFFHHQKLLE